MNSILFDHENHKKEFNVWHNKILTMFAPLIIIQNDCKSIKSMLIYTQNTSQNYINKNFKHNSRSFSFISTYINLRMYLGLDSFVTLTFIGNRFSGVSLC